MKTRVKVASALSLMIAIGATAAQRPPALADIIFDGDGFISRLSKKTLVDPNFLNGMEGIGDAEQAFNAAFHELGKQEDIEFVEITDGFVHPRVIRGAPPKFPAAKAKDQQSGHADYLVLMGRTGKVAALYCTSTTDRLFAIAGANALIEWSFSPAYLGQEPFRVLVMMRIRFTMIINGSPHSG